MAKKAAIKSRIKSVGTTKKITRAMELMASVKLQKQVSLLNKNKDYFEYLKGTIESILSKDIDTDSVYLKNKNNKKKLVIVFVSDVGLCGAYNLNLIKRFDEYYSKDIDLFIIGTSKYKWFKENYNVLNEETSSDEITFSDLKEIAVKSINMYKTNVVGSIEIVYTKFINNVTFTPEIIKVLPCELEEDNRKSNVELLLEPNPTDILNELIPMYAINFIYSKWLEAKTSEQGARRFAMQNATDNADELTDELLLEYNQARQAAITQEINEIVGGAEAL